MTAIDFEAFDADNHYYEALDAFTRHIEPAFAKRCTWRTLTPSRCAASSLTIVSPLMLNRVA